MWFVQVSAGESRPNYLTRRWHFWIISILLVGDSLCACSYQEVGLAATTCDDEFNFSNSQSYHWRHHQIFGSVFCRIRSHISIPVLKKKKDHVKLSASLFIGGHNCYRFDKCVIRWHKNLTVLGQVVRVHFIWKPGRQNAKTVQTGRVNTCG